MVISISKINFNYWDLSLSLNNFPRARFVTSATFPSGALMRRVPTYLWKLNKEFMRFFKMYYNKGSIFTLLKRSTNTSTQSTMVTVIKAGTALSITLSFSAIYYFKYRAILMTNRDCKRYDFM